MTNLLSMGLAWATLLPLLFLLARTGPLLRNGWSAAKPAVRVALVLLGLGGATVLLARPHEDTFAGLDVAAYRQMAHVLADGRGLLDDDAVFAQAPEELRRHFLYRPGGRLTRDLSFQLSSPSNPEARPFFMPTLPLAAAGVASWLSPDRFVPLVGALGWLLVVAVAFGVGGGWGLLVAAALGVMTAWPAWFLRGFYAEAVGAILVASVIAAAVPRPPRGVIAGPVAGFLLGLAVSFHPTLAVPAGIVAIGLMAESRRPRHAGIIVAGLVAGLAPAWALTRWVCQPYGDWTRWASLRRMVFGGLEHRAIAVSLVALALMTCVTGWGAFRPSVREKIRRLDAQLTPWGWLAIFLSPVLVVMFLPGSVGLLLRKGAVATWSGVRWSGAAIILAGMASLLTSRRPLRERFWFAGLAWAACVFLFIKGVETPVGLWSQRRFLPILLPMIALLAVPLAMAVKHWAACGGRLVAWTAVALLGVAGLWNLAHWPAAHVAVNERGSTDWTQAVARRLGHSRWVIFDYFPHSVPYAAGLQHRVLGLGEHAREQWPEVAAWVGALAQTSEVWVATSWSPTALEDGWRLDAVFEPTGVFSVVQAKTFYPAERGERHVSHLFARAVPIGAGDGAFQDKFFDGSPIGLRGDWGPQRKQMRWTRQGSGLIGPVPAPGGSVVFSAACEWTPPHESWREQMLEIHPPWGGPPLRLTVPTGEQQVEGRLVRPADDDARPATGVYSFRVEKPYNPAHYHLQGYPEDLGVLLRRVMIRVEPGGVLMPN